MNKMINFLNVASEAADTASEVAKEGMGWHPADALEVLPKAGVGMCVIFAIIGVIILSTVILGKISSNNKK